MKFKRLKNSVVVVTGSSSGIGYELCKVLADAKCKVYGISRKTTSIEGVSHIKADVTNKEDVKAAFNKILAEAGKIDVLINNAGMGISGAIETAPEEDINKIVGVNFIGTVNCIQEVLPFMRENRSGKIINVSSVAGLMPIPFQGFYSATKASVILLTESLRMEVKPFKVEAGSILPGDTKTSFTGNRVKSPLDSEYSAKEKKSVGVMEKDEQNGMSARYVALKIARYANKKKLPLAKVVGFKYKIFMLLNKFLPHKLVLYVISKMY